MASLDPQTNPYPLIPLYHIRPTYTMTALASFEIRGPDARSTFTFKVNAHHSADTVAFLDIKIKHLPGVFAYRDESLPITVTVGKSANPIATVDSLLIQDTHESPMSSEMQVRVHS